MKILSERKIPGRQGIRLELEIKSNWTPREILDSYYGKGVKTPRPGDLVSYGPGKYQMDCVSDAWGHNNSKQIWVSTI